MLYRKGVTKEVIPSVEKVFLGIISAQYSVLQPVLGSHQLIWGDIFLFLTKWTGNIREQINP